MRILTRNVIEENTAIVMTSADPNYTVENIYGNMMEDIVQGSANNTKITINFGEDKTVNSIFLGFHNASNVSVVFKNSGGSTLATEVMALPSVYDKKYITELTTVRSIEVTFTTIETYIFIGSFSCGKYVTIHNVKLPMVVEHVDSTLFAQTIGGQSLYRTGITLESYNVDSEKITDAQIAEFKTAYSYAHKGKTWWMDRHEDLEHPIFGMFDANYHTTRVNTLTNLSFSFKEAR